jgi:hypothetical protein
MTIKFILPYEIECGQRDEIVSEIDGLYLTLIQKRVLHGIKDMIIQRFELFDEEIRVEEIASKDAANILVDLRTGSIAVNYKNYSDKLKSRMTETLTVDDFNFAYRKLVGELGL